MSATPASRLGSHATQPRASCDRFATASPPDSRKSAVFRAPRFALLRKRFSCVDPPFADLRRRPNQWRGPYVAQTPWSYALYVCLWRSANEYDQDWASRNASSSLTARFASPRPHPASLAGPMPASSCSQRCGDPRTAPSRLRGAGQEGGAARPIPAVPAEDRFQRADGPDW
jgi:hypothetical protein